MKKISTAKAAKQLGVSRWTLRRWGDKKLIPFTTSKSGYRYYKAEDLDTLKEKHAIVHVKTKRQKIVIEKRDETLLLPSPPKPIADVKKEVPVQRVLPPPLEVKPVELVVPPPQSNLPAGEAGAAGTFDVPPPTPPTPPKRSVFSQFWKILPFTCIAVILVFVFFPIRPRPQTMRTPQMLLGLPVENVSSSFPLLSFRDVVLAAATDSAGIDQSSVQFFLSENSQSVDSMISPDGKTPESGNTIYLSNMTSFFSFEESPFAYLNGSHGPAGPVAIIDNEDTLRSHPFFANVHNGDKLLIYKESEKAVLFRPLTNEVVAFAPLNAVPSTSYAQIEGQPVVALRNGMGTPYDMKTFEAELTYISPKSVAVDNEIAGRSDYKNSIIVDVVGTKKEEAQALAYKLKLTLSELPAGEFRPPAGVDFLVILGRDRVPFMNYIAPTSTASATPKTQ